MRRIGAGVLAIVAVSCVDAMEFDWPAAGTGGTGGASFCTPDEKRPCYSGPETTMGVGSCKAGEQTCSSDGATFGPCEGEILPKGYEDCGTPGDDDCDGTALCNGEVLWTRHFGAPLDQVPTGVGCATGGDVAVTGYFSHIVDFGGGPLTAAGVGSPINADVFVARYDATGAHLWSERFGDGAAQRSRGLSGGDEHLTIVGDMAATIDFGGGTLTAAGGTDLFIARLQAASGAHVWSKSFGSSGDDVGYGVGVDGTGNAVVAGALSGPADFGGGPLPHAGGTDVLVAKLSAPEGAHLWSKTFGSLAEDAAHAVAVDGAGNVFLVGTIGGPVDFGGGQLAHAGGADIFIAKLDGTTGAHLWSKSFASAAEDIAYAVTVDGDGNVFLVGSIGGPVDFGGGQLAHAGGADIFIAKLDGTTGAHLWSRSFGGPGDDVATTVAASVPNTVLLGGSFEETVTFGVKPLTSSGGPDAFAARLDGGGGHIWSQRRGDDQAQQATAVCLTPAGQSVLSLKFQGSVDVDLETVTSAGGDDALLLRLGL